MLAQVIESVPDQLWEQPGTIIILFLVLSGFLGIMAWVLKQNADERRANSAFITNLVTNSLENQHELSQVMSRQTDAMSKQGDAMLKQGEAMQAMAASLKHQEELSTSQHDAHEARAEQRNQAIINTLSGLSIPMERRQP